MGFQHLCMGCMTDKGKASVCPNCQYQETGLPVSELYLYPRSLLRGRYLVGNIISVNPFSAVYIGYDTQTNQSVSIKEYLPYSLIDRETLSAFIQLKDDAKKGIYDFGLRKFIEESLVLKKLKSQPGMADVRDIFRENYTAYCVAEYPTGHTLAAYQAQVNAPLPLYQLLKIFKPLFSVLEQVHQKGLLHFDICPDNILVTDEGLGTFLNFSGTDMVMACNLESLDKMLRDGYAPIEFYDQIEKAKPTSEVYTLAATMYHLLTNLKPPNAIDRLENDTLVPPASLGIKISRKAQKTLLKALSVHPNRRYRSVKQFKRDLWEAWYVSDRKNPESAIDAFTFVDCANCGIMNEVLKIDLESGTTTCFACDQPLMIAPQTGSKTARPTRPNQLFARSASGGNFFEMHPSSPLHQPQVTTVRCKMCQSLNEVLTADTDIQTDCSVCGTPLHVEEELPSEILNIPLDELLNESAAQLPESDPSTSETIKAWEDFNAQYGEIETEAEAGVVDQASENLETDAPVNSEDASEQTDDAPDAPLDREFAQQEMSISKADVADEIEPAESVTTEPLPDTTDVPETETPVEKKGDLQIDAEKSSSPETSEASAFAYPEIEAASANTSEDADAEPEQMPVEESAIAGDLPEPECETPPVSEAEIVSDDASENIDAATIAITEQVQETMDEKELPELSPGFVTEENEISPDAQEEIAENEIPQHEPETPVEIDIPKEEQERAIESEPTGDETPDSSETSQDDALETPFDSLEKPDELPHPIDATVTEAPGAESTTDERAESELSKSAIDEVGENNVENMALADEAGIGFSGDHEEKLPPDLFSPVDEAENDVSPVSENGDETENIDESLNSATTATDEIVDQNKNTSAPEPKIADEEKPAEAMQENHLPGSNGKQSHEPATAPPVIDKKSDVTEKIVNGAVPAPTVPADVEPEQHLTPLDCPKCQTRNYFLVEEIMHGATCKCGYIFYEQKGAPEKKHSAKQAKKHIPVWMFAAILTLIISVAGLFYWQQKQSMANQQYSEYIRTADNFFEQQNYESALANYLRALQERPNAPYAQRKLLESQDLLNAELLSQRQVSNEQLARLEIAALSARADSLMKAGQYSQAGELYQQLLAAAPGDSALTGKLAEINRLIAQSFETPTATASRADTLTVSPDLDLQTRIDQAAPFTTITFRRGIYELKTPLQINKSLTFKGVGSSFTMFIFSAAGTAITVSNAADFTVENIGFVCQNTLEADIVQVNYGQLIARDCEFRGAKMNTATQKGGHAIIFTGKSRGEISNSKFNENGVALLIREFATPEIRGSEFWQNETAIEITDDARPQLSQNRIRNNYGDGLIISGKARPTLTENIIVENFRSGVVFISANYSGTLRGNKISNNRSTGVIFSESSQPILEQNEISFNHGGGILIKDDSRGILKENTIERNKFFGIKVLNKTQPSIQRNTIKNNGGDGVEIADAAKPTVDRNEILQNKGDGISLLLTQNGGLLQNNTCRDNQGYGISILKAFRAKMVNNTLVNNYEGDLYEEFPTN